MYKFKIGDKVVVTKIGETSKRYGIKVGDIGTVLEMSYIPYLKMEKYNPLLHSSMGLCEKGHGFSMAQEQLELAAKKTPKELLETGMVVEMAGGNMYLVLRGKFNTMHYRKQELVFQRELGFVIGDEYDDNLLYTKSDSRADIKKIYQQKAINNFHNNFDEDELELIWEREKPVSYGGIKQIRNNMHKD